MCHSPVFTSICPAFLPVSMNWSCFYPRPTPPLLRQVPYFFPHSSMCKYSSNNSPISLLVLKFSFSTEPFLSTPNILKQTKLKRSLEFISPFSFSCYHISMPLKKKKKLRRAICSHVQLLFPFSPKSSSIRFAIRCYTETVSIKDTNGLHVVKCSNSHSSSSWTYQHLTDVAYLFESLFLWLTEHHTLFFPFLMNCSFFVFFVDLFSSPQPKSIHI